GVALSVASGGILEPGDVPSGSRLVAGGETRRFFRRSLWELTLRALTGRAAPFRLSEGTAPEGTGTLGSPGRTASRRLGMVAIASATMTSPTSLGRGWIWLGRVLRTSPRS